MSQTLAAGDLVLLLDTKGRRYLVTLTEGKEFHSHSGFVAHADLIGANEGDEVMSTRGGRYTVLRPTLSEFVLKMPRGAQVIYPKDLGPILMLADIGAGTRVLESGIGRAHNIHLSTLPNFRKPGDTSSSSRYFAKDIVNEPLEARDGLMPVPAGAGIGVTVPLSQSVFLLVNVSGIFLYSAFEGMEDDFDNDQKWVYTSYGANGSLSLAWYVDSMTTTISLGARYQYLHNNRNSRRSDAITDPDDTDPFDGNADRFYGLTFSAVYSFEL